MDLNEMRKIAEQRGLRGDPRKAESVYMPENALIFYNTAEKTFDALLDIFEATSWYYEIDEAEMKYFNPKYFPAYYKGKEALKKIKDLK